MSPLLSGGSGRVLAPSTGTVLAPGQAQWQGDTLFTYAVPRPHFSRLFRLSIENSLFHGQRRKPPPKEQTQGTEVLRPLPLRTRQRLAHLAQSPRDEACTSSCPSPCIRMYSNLLPLCSAVEQLKKLQRLLLVSVLWPNRDPTLAWAILTSSQEAVLRTGKRGPTESTASNEVPGAGTWLAGWCPQPGGGGRQPCPPGAAPLLCASLSPGKRWADVQGTPEGCKVRQESHPVPAGGRLALGRRPRVSDDLEKWAVPPSGRPTQGRVTVPGK